jgi:peptidoglycan/LPS O-acetylase OafA/YrhL
MTENPADGTSGAAGHGLPPRAIGRRGTIARLVIGVLLAGSVIETQRLDGFDPTPWLLGLAGFPAVLLAWQWLRTRRNLRPVHAIGVAGHTVCLAIGLGLALTPSYAPALSVTQPAVALFYGVSMLLAVVRGYAGCEVLALSNWLMRRDDQVGCVLFTPIDHLDRAHHA